MPKILKSTLALGLIAALTITALNSSRAQIEAISAPAYYTIIPNNAYIATAISNQSGPYFLKFSSIQKNLEDQGIAVTVSEEQPSLRGLPPTALPVLTFRFPGSNHDTRLQSWGDENRIISVESYPNNAPTEKAYYLSLQSFVQQLKAHSGLAVWLEGWRNFKLHIGSTVLFIGTEKTPITPEEIYSTVGLEAAQHGFSQIQGTLEPDPLLPHAVRVNAPAGSVYLMVTTARKYGSQSAAVARVASDGVLYFNAPYKVLEFVKTPLEVVQDRIKVNFYTNYGTSSRPAKALLIRISPDLKTRFELPARVRSIALK